MVNVTIYKKRETWWMQYRFNGVRIRKSLHTKNENVAKRLSKAQEIKLIKGEVEVCKKRKTLDSFWQEYLPFAKARKRPNTVKNDSHVFEKFSIWFSAQGKKYLDQIKSEHFEKYRLYLQGRGLKKSSINVFHKHLSSILSTACQMGYLENNPIKKVKLLKIETKPPIFMNKDEIAILLQFAEKYSKEMHMLVALGLYAGLRRSEIAHTRWEWFDFKNMVILIQPNGRFIPKNHLSRPIPLSKKLIHILLPLKQESGFLFKSSVNESERKNIIRYDFKKSFSRVTQNADLDWVTPHTLRHTFASQLALAGVSLYKIQKWLGHSNPKTTMIYAHLQAQDDEINLI